MPPKGSKPTSDELLAQFDSLGVESTAEPSTKPPATAATAPPQTELNEDIIAELGNLASQRPSSRAGTPRTSTHELRTSTKSPKLAATPAGRSSEEKIQPRKSGENGRYNKAQDAQPTTSEQSAAEEKPSSSGGGGWWGGIFATASATAAAAVKQAEAAVKEIQQNEEALKWADQVRGNVGALRDLGTVYS
jgi:hypothetical protein